LHINLYVIQPAFFNCKKRILFKIIKIGREKPQLRDFRRFIGDEKLSGNFSADAAIDLWWKDSSTACTAEA